MSRKWRAWSAPRTRRPHERPDRAGQFFRFTGRNEFPAYVDLLDIAAITEARAEGQLIPGARVVLYSGFALFVMESPEAVFDLVHAAQNPAPEKPPHMRSEGAPAPTAHRALVTAEEDDHPGEKWRVRHKFRAAHPDTPPITDEYASATDAWAAYEVVRKKDVPNGKKLIDDALAVK